MFYRILSVENGVKILAKAGRVVCPREDGLLAHAKGHEYRAV
jgi:hypothetical protein